MALEECLSFGHQTWDHLIIIHNSKLIHLHFHVLLFWCNLSNPAAWSPLRWTELTLANRARLCVRSIHLQRSHLNESGQSHLLHQHTVESPPSFQSSFRLETRGKRDAGPRWHACFSKKSLNSPSFTTTAALGEGVARNASLPESESMSAGGQRSVRRSNSFSQK